MDLKISGKGIGHDFKIEHSVDKLLTDIRNIPVRYYGPLYKLIQSLLKNKIDVFLKSLRRLMLMYFYVKVILI
jgi:hypothetical protein